MLYIRQLHTYKHNLDMAKRSERVNHNQDLLDSIVKRDGCELIGDYGHLNRETIITFLCGVSTCRRRHQKTHRNLNEFGAFCASCTVMKGVDKAKGTFMFKYGVTNPQKCDKIKEQTEKTVMARFGVKNPMQNKEVREKGKATNVIKYGVENPFQSQEIKDKIKEKNLQQYGVEHSQQREDVKERSIQTCLEKYGVRHSTQVPEIFEKCMRQAYKLKEYVFPCGTVVEVQGYEPYALDMLVAMDYTFDDITIAKHAVPNIWYDALDGKKKRYYPDIYIERENTIIEVKSDYTWRVDKLKCDLIRKECDKRGIKFYVWVFNKNQELVECV